MISFEVTAIDIILVMAVAILWVLYWTKLSKIPEEQVPKRSAVKHPKPEKSPKNPQNGYAECPRGFGYIKKIGDVGSVSDRCLGCYRIMECYSEGDTVKPQFTQV